MGNLKMWQNFDIEREQLVDEQAQRQNNKKKLVLAACAVVVGCVVFACAFSSGSNSVTPTRELKIVTSDNVDLMFGLDSLLGGNAGLATAATSLMGNSGSMGVI